MIELVVDCQAKPVGKQKLLRFFERVYADLKAKRTQNRGVIRYVLLLL